MRRLAIKWVPIIIISFVILFLVSYQIYRITHLDLHYLGEEVGFHIAPSYILFIILVPASLLLIVLLPGLLIVSINLEFPTFDMGFKGVHLIYLTQLNMSIKKTLNRNKIYMVIRC